MPAADPAPVSAAGALDPARLFAPFERHKGVLLAVSGGPDSTALMLLAQRWLVARGGDTALHVATVDHGLREGARREAEAVGRLAERLGLPHAILPWLGEKAATGLQEAARDARYALLAGHAAAIGASAIATAHTSDDQAETILFRLMRGSGLAGLSGIPGERALGDLALLRPLLDVSKATLIEVCRAAGAAFSEDPSNRNTRFARVRLRALLPLLAAEGLDAERFARLARRMARADAALEVSTDAAAGQVSLAPWRETGPVRLSRPGFSALPAEIALRLLGRAVEALGHEGPVELGKLEALQRWIEDVPAGHGASRTLAGAVIKVSGATVTIGPAPARRVRFSSR